MVKLFSLFFLLIVGVAFGQNTGGFYNGKFQFQYGMADGFDPNYFEDGSFGDDSSYVALDRTIVAYEVSDGQLLRKIVSHKVCFVANEDDIEKINRLYIYEGSGHSIENIEVRTILKGGEMVYLDESKMENISQEDGKINIKILAISGIESKCWVETIITKYQPAHLRVSIESPFPTVKAEVYAHCADAIRFRGEERVVRTKGYGLFKKLKYNSSDNFKFSELKNRFYTPIYIAEYIKTFKEEPYSHEFAEASYIDIVDQTYSWEEACIGISETFFPTSAYNEVKCQSWLNEIGIQNDSTIDKIYAIEKFVREEVEQIDGEDEDLEKLSKIWKKRKANKRGVILFMEQLFRASDIKYIVYLSSDKNYLQLDSNFAFSYGLDELIFHFPDQDLYLVPSSRYYYIGRLPKGFASCKALKIKSEGVQVDESRIVRLPESDKTKDLEGTIAHITLDLDKEICVVEETKLFFGDGAIISRGYYHFSDDDDRKEYIEALLVDKLEMELSDVKVTNEALDLNFQSKDTLFYSGTLTGSQILSSIPNGFILNPGAVMGTQVSFYDTEERKSDIYIPESKVYEHTIIVEIPDGYAVEGTDKLAFDKQFFAHKRWLYGESEEDAESFDEAEVMAQFVSEVTVSDSQVRIDIYEYYVEGFYPKQGIEDLQEVVNAAYEFFIAKIKLVKE